MYVAASFRARLFGLAGLREMPPGAVLLIPRCSSVHTFGMRFPIDVLFLDERLRGDRRAARGEAAARSVWHRGARAVLEFQAAEPDQRATQPVAQRAQRQVLGHVQLAARAAPPRSARPPRAAGAGRARAATRGELLGALGVERRLGRLLGQADQVAQARARPGRGPGRAPRARRGASRAWPPPRTGSRARCGRGPWARTRGARRASRDPRLGALGPALLGARRAGPAHGASSPAPASALGHHRSTSAQQRLALLGGQPARPRAVAQREPRAGRARDSAARRRPRAISAIRAAGSGSKRTSWQRDTTVGSTWPSASVSRIRCTNGAGSSSVLSSRLATSSFMVSTRSSTNTRRADSNGVRVAAATTGLVHVLECASRARPSGVTQVRSGWMPVSTRRRTLVGVRRRPRRAARRRTRAPPSRLPTPAGPWKR